jgi:CRISPR system Cascade subunit CasE
VYLSQVTLNPLNRLVHRDLADCHQLHRTIMRAFPDLSSTSSGSPSAPRADFGVLYRVDIDRRQGSIRALVQSSVQPDWSRLSPGYVLSDPAGRPLATTKPIDQSVAGITTGQQFAFRLRANPTKRIHRQVTPDGKVWSGKRVDLRREEDWLVWLARKAEQGGFELVTVQAAPAEPNAIVPDIAVAPAGRVISRQRQLTFGAVVFEGRLRITDPERFRATLASGIGSAKAYGFGLLSIAPAQ